MDEERAYLRRVDVVSAEHRKQRSTRDGSSFGYGNEPFKAWSGVSPRARAALRDAARRAPERLERVERALLDFAVETAGGAGGSSDAGAAEAPDGTRDEPVLVLPFSDAYARLLAHGLCEFHGFSRASRIAKNGAKELVVQPPVASDSGRRSETTDPSNSRVDDGVARRAWRPPDVTCASFLRGIGAQMRAGTGGVTA
jgi:hypothetical protein